MLTTNISNFAHYPLFARNFLGYVESPIIADIPKVHMYLVICERCRKP